MPVELAGWKEDQPSKVGLERGFLVRHKKVGNS
jgi:hypothetical protein